MENANLIKEMYKSKKDLIVLGLTGRTGSGCTTVAKILEQPEFTKLDLESPKDYDYLDMEERKYKVYYEYLNRDENWQPFQTIELSSVILYFALTKGEVEIKKWLEGMVGSGDIKIPELKKINKVIENKLKVIIEKAKEINFDIVKNLSNSLTNSSGGDKDIEKYYNYFTKDIKENKETMSEAFKDCVCIQMMEPYKEGSKEEMKHNFFSYFLQMLGNNIRKTGKPFDSTSNVDNYNGFIEKVVYIIELIRKYNKIKGKPTRICIDAIRNPYESYYLHDKYRSYLLLAISTEDKDRRERLGFLDKDEFTNLDNVEYPPKFKSPAERFYHQNIQECLETADIHIYNPNVTNIKRYRLSKQLIKYVSLILHPGLVTPTHIERCMQLAFNAKYNSGCLSRQVGAIVTRSDYSVQAVGWNDVPKGQVSCGLRDAFNFTKNSDDTTYSEYEIGSEEFGCVMKEICDNLKDNKIMYPYCFKNIYNNLKNDKNQVYTRALHAEENAFLQISKYGGSEIQGGYLFVTASPCELCSKKSFQLGIKKIYYIDPYPGISQKHIISYNVKNKPEMNLFFGAIGNAYMELYSQRIAYKDELELVTGIITKNIVKKAINKDKTSNPTDFNENSSTEKENKLTDVSELEPNEKEKVSDLSNKDSVN